MSASELHQYVPTVHERHFAAAFCSQTYQLKGMGPHTVFDCT